MSLFVNNNGNLVPADGYVIPAGNRGHLYGDGLFESVKVMKGHPINLVQHINRLVEGMQVLKMEIPENFKEVFFEREIQTLLTKNNIHGGGRVRISVDRSPGGRYLPASNKIDYLIEAEPMLPEEFQLNTKGFHIDLYEEIKKQVNILSPYKTKNCLTYILGRIEAKERGLDDLLILNDKMGIIESTNSNLFLVSNGVLYTAGMDQGCLGGTMRMQIINLSIANNIKVYECNISPQNLLAADEVFLTNAIQGISWVERFRSKDYTNKMAQNLISILNERWLSSLK